MEPYQPFAAAVILTGRWLAVLKEDKHDLVEKPSPGAVLMCAARRTARAASNAFRCVVFRSDIVQLKCVRL